MAKNLLQDMVRVKKNPNEEGEKIKIIKKIEKIEKSEKIDRIEIEKTSDKIKTKNKKPRYGLYFVALVSIIFLFFAISFFFAETKVTIIPKIQDVPINDNLSATKDSTTSDLSFDLAVISGEESKTIPGGQEKDVATVATGTVLIYNSYNTSPQIFVSGTRLEGSNGKIYKINKKITVPPMKKDMKPTNVEVSVSGIIAGEEYNSDPIDFKIPTLKGTPKYTKFYGRSKGNIVGGFKGKTYDISPLDKINVTSELKNILKTKLISKITDQIPVGFILFKDAVFLDTSDSDISFTASNDKDNNVLVTMKGKLYGFLFDQKKLTQKVAEDVVEKYDGSDIYIPNIRDLVFSLSDGANISFADVNNINFNLTGTPKIIWKVDEVGLIDSMLNKRKSEFNQILAQFSSIDSAQLILRPFWETYFPSESKNIQIIVNYPQ